MTTNLRQEGSTDNRPTTRRSDVSAVALPWSAEDVRALLDHMPAMIGYWDKDLRNRFANKDYRFWFGVDPEWVVGRHIREILGESIYALNVPHIEAVLRGEAQFFERSIPAPDGGHVRHSQAHYIPDIKDGEVRGFYVLVSDVTELKKTEAALRGSEERLRAIFDVLPIGLVLTDAQGRIVDCNSSAPRLLGLRREDCLGRGLSDAAWCFRRPEGAPVASEEHVGARALRDGQPEQDVVVEYVSSRGNRWFSFSAMPVELAEFGIVLAFVDITEQRRLEEERLEMHERVEAMAREQVTYQALAGLAHTFNQPLSALGFYLESALKLVRAGQAGPEKLSPVLHGAVAEVERAGGVLRELLGHFYKPRTDTRIHDLTLLVMERARKQVFGISHDYPVALEFPDGPVFVRVNGQQMGLIIDNLLRNSCEAMRDAGIPQREGAIVVRVVRLDCEAHVSVRDNGPGIPAGSVRRVFEPFYSTKEEGTGMGLAISRTLVEAQGGKLWHEAMAGGACFHFTVPLAE